VAAPSEDIPIPYKYSRSAPNKDATRHHFINRPVCANKERAHFLFGAASPPFKAGSQTLTGLPSLTVIALAKNKPFPHK
jgi:hypothetical protein